MTRRGFRPTAGIDRLGLGKGQKTVVAVVVAHAGLADATEGQILLNKMQHRVVDGHAAGVYFRQNA